MQGNDQRQGSANFLLLMLCPLPMQRLLHDAHAGAKLT
jgi:hypothetical protein